MRVFFITSLFLIGLLRISESIDSKMEAILKEVKSNHPERLTKLKSSQRPKSLSNSSPPSPKVIKSSKSTKEIILLNGKKELRDKELKIMIPALDENQFWLLEIDYELRSVENLKGYDDPAFKILIDDNLVYNQSFLEVGENKIIFNPKAFSDLPKLITIWSGNSGDNENDSWSIISKIKLFSMEKPTFIETEPILKVDVTKNENFLTLEFDSPQTSDSNLDRPLKYEIRYLDRKITLQNWYQAKLVEFIHPEQTAPQLAGNKELILIEGPQTGDFINIRSFDSMGELSSLGKNIEVKALDY